MSQVDAASEYEYALPDHWIDHKFDPEGPFTKLHSYYVGRVVDIIKQSGARTVLEAGCGDGWNVAQFVAAGLDVSGCDWSAKGIQYAQMNSPSARLYCGDVRDDEFIRRFPEKFDAVALVEVIEHIPPEDTVEALRTLLTRLRPGGIFVLTTPHLNYPNTAKNHYRHFAPEQLENILTEVGGMEVVAVEGYGDLDADRRFWRRMRWFDNRHYSIKYFANRLRRNYRYVGPPAWDRAHGIILTARKTP